ncbi:hypothetical protein [Oricola cellulosilytica]|nr:hypothetical protein [Oricola cellulosilytica]
MSNRGIFGAYTGMLSVASRQDAQPAPFSRPKRRKRFLRLF